MSKSNQLIKCSIIWLPVVFLITLFCFLVYVSVQQDMRIGANDPQIKIAEDTADELTRGETTGSLLSENKKIDIANSLASYIVIYNQQGQPVNSSGFLDGQMPDLPRGIFSYVDKSGEDRLTWQPRTGVRSAIVVTSFKNYPNSGYVMVGRSLREVEKREDQLLVMVFFTWILGIFISTVFILGKHYFQR